MDGSLFLKMSLLVISEILGLFFNILTADGKYSLRNRENLWDPIQMHLYEKSYFFIPLPEIVL